MLAYFLGGLHAIKPLNHVSKETVLEITMDIQYYNLKKLLSIKVWFY